MKTLIIFLTCLLMGAFCFSQLPGRQQIQSDARLLSTKANGYATIQTYNEAAKGSQFYPEVWSKGVLQTTDNLKYDSGYLFILDKVHQQLFVQIIGTSKTLNIDKNQIKEVIINKDEKNHIFGISDNYLKPKEGNFCEILVDNPNKYSFIKIIITKYIHADNTDFAKMKEGDFRDEFLDKISYYLIKPDLSFNKILLNEKGIKKAFPKNELVSQYLELNANASIDENYLINMINSINLNINK